MTYLQKIERAAQDIESLGFNCVRGKAFTLVASGIAGEPLRVEALVIRLSDKGYRMASYNEYHTGTESAETELNEDGLKIFLRLFNIGESGTVRVVVI
jgi:hypothetical protein